MKFLYSVHLEDEIGKFRRLGGRNLNFACWADDTDLILEFLILGVLIQNYHKKSYLKNKNSNSSPFAAIFRRGMATGEGGSVSLPPWALPPTFF